ncbi:MAG: M6 family metalloprotease domain-containing protein [Acidobacteriota bacterium]
MKWQHVLWTAIFFIGIVDSGWAAPVRFLPQTLVQPNGDTIHVFVSGDEYHHWLHDENEYTIVQDPTTGYYTYAVRIKTGTGIGASQFRVGTVDPAREGLEPNVNLSAEAMEKLRADEIRSMNEGRSPSSLTKSSINNIVIFVRFKDDPEFQYPITTYDSLFNSRLPGASSVANYFDEASYHQMAVTTSFYPQPAGTMVRSFQDTLPRAYYQPYNAVTNPIGYSTVPNNTEWKNRLQELFRDVMLHVAPEIPSSLNVDADTNGRVDNIIILFKGKPDPLWDAPLWPRCWAIWENFGYIHGIKAGTINMQFEDCTVGTLCHEFFHTLNAPDYYRYPTRSKQPSINPVGYWDVAGRQSNTPQHMSAYTKYKYGGWIGEIPEITEKGRYTLEPVGSSKNCCYKVRSKKTAKDYFVIEFRRRQGTFETSLPGEGLLVYRVHVPLEGKGNVSGPPDELYVFRPGGTISSDGDIIKAALSAETGRTALNYWSTNPLVFLSDSSLGDLSISDVSRVGETISFNVGMEKPVDTLFAGSVNKRIGTTDDDYKFSVWYRSLKAPDSLQLHCGGKTYAMSAGSGRWADTVRFMKTLVLPQPGTYRFFFTAFVNGDVLRFPTSDDSLTLTVVPGEDSTHIHPMLAVASVTTSKAGIVPGDAFAASAVIQNTMAGPDHAIRNIRYTISFRDPMGMIIDERTGIIDSLQAGEAKFVFSAPDFLALSVEGNYDIVCTATADTLQGSLARTFYAGRSPMENRYLVSDTDGRIRMNTASPPKDFAGGRWSLKNVDAGHVAVQDTSASPMMIAEHDFGWWGAGKQFILCDNIDGSEATMSFGSQTAQSTVTFDRTVIQCMRGNAIQYTASAHGILFSRTDLVFYKNLTVSSWHSSCTYAQGDSVAKIIITVPSDAPLGNHQAFAAFDLGQGNAQFIQGLQIFVRGLWTGIDAAEAEPPKAYSLEQNYPNPFNPSTTIRYCLSVRSMVRLRIYNTLGQLVKELVNAEQDAGARSVVWNADAPSGMYFCRIEALDVSNSAHRYVDTKKMMLIH